MALCNPARDCSILWINTLDIARKLLSSLTVYVAPYVRFWVLLVALSFDFGQPDPLCLSHALLPSLHSFVLYFQCATSSSLDACSGTVIAQTF